MCVRVERGERSLLACEHPTMLSVSDQLETGAQRPFRITARSVIAEQRRQHPDYTSKAAVKLSFYTDNL